MTQPLLTLADWTDLIVPAIVVASVVGSWIHGVLKKYGEQRKSEVDGYDTDLEAMAARRREELIRARRQGTQGGSQASMRVSDSPDMSMAERIARARAKAQQEQQGGAVVSNDETMAQARRQQALAQRRAELQQQQKEAALARKRAQEQARLRAQQQQRQAQAQAQARRQRAAAHARAQAQARQRGTLMHEQVQATEPTESSTRRQLRVTKRREPVPALIPIESESGPVRIGRLSRNELRRAIVMNEVLGKPLALRDE